MKSCKVCGSYAINHHLHSRDGSVDDLCDVCYWREKAESLRHQNDELLLALRLAKDMFVANDLILPHTFEVIDDAIEFAGGAK